MEDVKEIGIGEIGNSIELSADNRTVGIYYPNEEYYSLGTMCGGAAAGWSTIRKRWGRIVPTRL